MQHICFPQTQISPTSAWTSVLLQLQSALRGSVSWSAHPSRSRLGSVPPRRPAAPAQWLNVIDFLIVLAFVLDLGGLSHLVLIRMARSLRLTRLIRFGPVILLQEVPALYHPAARRQWRPPGMLASSPGSKSAMRISPPRVNRDVRAAGYTGKLPCFP